MRKIAVITGARADYGLLRYIIKEIHDDASLRLQLIVTGMHLSPEFGLTVREIEKDGFPIADKIEMLLSSDTDSAIVTSMGVCMIGLAKSFERLKPDILLVLGDRFEALAAVSAAVPFRIPVAHIHGGEITEGAIDELFRHAITKMSHIHFPAIKPYAKRIIQMGEQPRNVYCFGAPGLDNLFKMKLLSKRQLAKILDLPEERPWGAVTFHPVTVRRGSAKAQIKTILNSLSSFPDICWVFTFPNADMESRVIIGEIEKYVGRRARRAFLFSSLGQLKYLSLMKNSVVMVGNSSSGIIEAPSLKLPVVNIGSRQKGRIRAKNVIDVQLCEESRIRAAISKALSKKFKGSLKDLKNPYGAGDTSKKITDVLKTVSLVNRFQKQFYDLRG